MATKKISEEGAQDELEQGKLKAAENPAEGTIVSLKKTMWVEGTGNSKHLAKGSKHEVNEISGAKLISKGAAVETKAPAKAKPVVKKDNNTDDDE